MHSGFSRLKAEPQVPMTSRRRGDEIIQVHHHAAASNLGNGQMRLKPQHHHHMQHLQNPQNVYRNENRSLLSHDHYTHLNPDAYDRRESSSSVASSAGSYESGSTLTSDLGDSAIMHRLRKSFEQKEEFLRGTTQPTGYVSDNSPELSKFFTLV